MKKRLFAIILCIALLCPLASCSDKINLMKLEGAERADAFFDIVNEDPADAYSVGMDMKIEGSLYGLALEAEIEIDTTYIDYKSNFPSYHSELKSVITAGEVKQKTSSVTGYRDGKLYEMTERDGVKNALASSISAEDFKAHKDFLVGYSDEELEALHKSATVKDCIKNEDGTWSASFSGYSEESVLALIAYAFDTTVLMLDGYKVKDVIFTIEANSDFLPTDWEYEIVFEKTSGDYPEPEAKTEIEFDNIGTAKAPEIDLSSYTEVEGLVELQKLRAALGEYLTSEKAGGFKAESKQSVNSGTSMNSTHETDTVTYEVKNGKYIFDIDATVKSLIDPAGTDYIITYRDGKFVMLQKGTSNSQRQEMTESNARLFIYRLIDPAGLSDALVSNIKTNDGEYTHTFTIADPDYAALEASLAPLGATNFKADASVSVVYKNEALEKYYYSMTMTCEAGGLTVTVKVESTVYFDDIIKE
jgi:hypothetical protein